MTPFLLFSMLLLVQGPTDSFSVADVLSAPVPGQLHVATKTDRIAWVANERGVRNVYIAEAPSYAPHRLTAYAEDDGRSIDIAGFSHNDAFVVIVTGRQVNATADPGGGVTEEILAFPIGGGEPIALGEGTAVAISPTSLEIAVRREKGLAIESIAIDAEPTHIALRGFPSGISFSPNGRLIAMSLRRASNGLGYAFIAIYDRDREKVTYIDPATTIDRDPVFSPDGSKLAFYRLLRQERIFNLAARTFPWPDPYEIRVHDLETGETATAWRAPDHDTLAFAGFDWMDDETLAFISERTGWRNLFSVPAAGGEPISLAEGDFIVEEIVADHARKRLLITTNEGDPNRRHVWSVDKRGKRERLTGTTGIQWSPRPLASGGLAHLGSDARQPATVYVREENDSRRLVAPPDTFPLDALVVPKGVVFEASDGLEVHGQLFLPPKRFSGERPAVMFFHGGPVRQMLLGWHYRGYYHNCYAFNQYLAARGFVVLAVNYRLGVGYGRAFRDVPDGGPRGASEYRDLLAGAAFLRDHDRVDADRIGLWGGSYGGMLTALGLARNSDLFAAGLDLHGVHDWNQWQAWARDVPDDDHRTVWKSSPIADLSSWRSPVMLVHGDDDRNVPFSETIWLAEALRKQGTPFELVVIPDDVHGFLLYRNWKRVFEAGGDFLIRELAP